MDRLVNAILDLKPNKCDECGKDATHGMHDEIGFRCAWCLPENTGITWIEDFKDDAG